MVFKKKLSYGFNGFLAPYVPRAARSIRRRTTDKKVAEQSQVCAFELLASLAGKLLQESESSASSNASEGRDHCVIDKEGFELDAQLKEKSPKTECHDQESGEVSVARSESVTSSSINLRESPHVESHSIVEQASTNTNSFGSKESHDWKSHEGITAHGNFTGKMEPGLPTLVEPFDCKMENGFETVQAIKSLETGALTMHPHGCFLEDPTEPHMKFPSSLNCDKDEKLHLGRSPFPNASFPKNRNDTKLGIRDDYENFSRFNKFRNRFKASRPLTRIVDRRRRKLLASSKYWKATPKLKDFKFSRADEGAVPLYSKRKNCYNFERNYYNVIYKKRKLCDPSSVLTSDGGVSSDSISNLPEKNAEKSCPSRMLNGGPSFTGHQVTRRAKDSHVNFSIKSFRIPELIIEVAETATVGSLKRTVMEAVTALLVDGIRVGVLLQGKKVRDDKRTLSQTGISCKDNLDALGFTLEPSPLQAPPVCREDHPLPLLCDASQDLSRYQIIHDGDLGPPKALPEPHILTSIVNHVDINHELVTSHTDKPTEESLPQSKALVPVPPINTEALAVVPVNQQKIRKSELTQRRIRRPFSVPEVEALVQAVEEVGTGRWRDVKLRAFENADHRTYVDLKDKWKTLVHTAQISPQQRRGEPVPQELLDRVLAAHAYWSQQQGKLQSGRMALEMCK